MEVESKRIIDEYETSLYKTDGKPIILWAAGANSPCLSLLFGNDSAGHAFNPDLSSLCKKQHQFLVTVRRPFIRGDLKELSEVNWDFIITSKDVLNAYDYMSNYGVVKEYRHDVVVIYRR